MSIKGSGPPTKTPPPPPPEELSPSAPTPSPAAAPGEENASLGPPDAATDALAAALDEPILTDVFSGAQQLLSTAIPDGFSDPFATAAAGWQTGAQQLDPYTGAVASDTGFAALNGADVDPYTAATDTAATDTAANAFTDTRSIEPYGGTANAEPYTGGDGAATASPRLAFGIDAAAAGSAGAGESDTAQSSAGQSDAGQSGAGQSGAGQSSAGQSDAGQGGPGQTWVGYVYDSQGNVTAFRYVDSNGVTTLVPANEGPVAQAYIFPDDRLTGTAPSAQPAAPPGTMQPAAAPAPSPSLSPPPSPSPSPPAAAAAPVSDQTPAPPPTPPPDQPPAPPAPPPAAAQPSPGTVPFDPMADSPFARWLLYGADTPVRDFLTSDANLRVAQNTALGIATGAAAAATGGLALEAAPAVLAGIGAGGSSASLPLLTAAGAVAASPQAQQELEEGLETLGPELENTLSDVSGNPPIDTPDIAEEAASLFQDRVRQAEALLRESPDLIQELGGRHTGAPVSAAQLNAAAWQYAQGNSGFARALGGNAMEALVNAINEAAPRGDGWFEQVGGASRIDFVGRGAYEGFTFELTTEAGVLGHSTRIYLQQAGAMIFTYTLPFE